MACPLTSVTAASPVPASTTFATAASLVARSEPVETPPPHLSRPYVYPSDCAIQWSLSSASKNHRDSFEGPYMSEDFLYQNQSDHYTSCQPLGLTSLYQPPRTKARVYHGAVCPSGWHGFQVGMESASGKSTGPSTWSTAFCCKTGDKLVEDLWSVYEKTLGGSACVSESHGYRDRTTKSFYNVAELSLPVPYLRTYTSTTTSQGTTYTIVSTEITMRDGYGKVVTTSAPFPQGRAFYPPWSIQWVQEDNDTLSPTWPTLTNDMLLPTWQSIDTYLSTEFEFKGKGRDRNPPPPSIQIKIAYPIIVVLAGIILIMAIIPLWSLYRRKRHAASQRKHMKRKDKLDRRLPDTELEMADLGTDSEAGRHELQRGEVTSEVHLNEVPNTLPVEGDDEAVSSGGRR